MLIYAAISKPSTLDTCSLITTPVELHQLKIICAKSRIAAHNLQQTRETIVVDIAICIRQQLDAY